MIFWFFLFVCLFLVFWVFWCGGTKISVITTIITKEISYITVQKSGHKNQGTKNQGTKNQGTKIRAQKVRAQKVRAQKVRAQKVRAQKIRAQKNQGTKNHGIVVRGCASYHHTTGLIPGPGVICAFSLSLVLFLISFLLKNKHSEFQFDLQTEDRNSHLVECQLLNPSCYPIPFIRIKCRLKVKTSRLSMKIYLLVTLLLIFFARGLCRKPSPPITTGLPNLFTPLFTFPNFFFFQ